MHPTALAFRELSTPLMADACLKLDVPVRLAPHGIRPLVQGMRVAGRVVPARHYGSVDVFFEAFEAAAPEGVLVVDNAGRTDEGCIGDLTALEARSASISGLVVWGTHRDSTELREVGLPVFSYGACPTGPRRLDVREPEALSSARFGEIVVSANDAVFADDDGVLFAPWSAVDSLLAAAGRIRDTERAQADAVRAGRTLRDQLRFREYLQRREEDPTYTLRKHLQEIGGAIEA